MKFKRVIMDIDDTLTTYKAERENLRKMFDSDLFSKYYPENGWHTYAFEDDPLNVLTEEDADLFWQKHERDIYEEAQLIPNYRELVTRFLDKDATVTVITNRDANMRNVTSHWLDQNKVQFDDLIMMSGNSKIPLIDSLEADLVIEDKPSFVSELHQQSRQYIDGKLKLVLVDHPYNQNCSCDWRFKADK